MTIIKGAEHTKSNEWANEVNSKLHDHKLKCNPKQSPDRAINSQPFLNISTQALVCFLQVIMQGISCIMAVICSLHAARIKGETS